MFEHAARSPAAEHFMVHGPLQRFVMRHDLTFKDLGSSTTYNPSGTAGITSTATATVGNTTQTFNFTTTSANAWTTETMFFTATSNLSSTLITIQGSTGVKYIGLDNVSVNAVAVVPEPASLVVWSLLGLGGVSVCWWQWRQRAV